MNQNAINPKKNIKRKQHSKSRWTPPKALNKKTMDRMAYPCLSQKQGYRNIGFDRPQSQETHEKPSTKPSKTKNETWNKNTLNKLNPQIFTVFTHRFHHLKQTQNRFGWSTNRPLLLASPLWRTRHKVPDTRLCFGKCQGGTGFGVDQTV